MKKIVIAMSNKLQAEKLAIALSHSFDSTIVNTDTKLYTILESSANDIFTVIFEEDKGCDKLASVINNNFSREKHQFTSVQITDITSNIEESISTVVLKKPFGLKQLDDTIANIKKRDFSDSVAIA